MPRYIRYLFFLEIPGCINKAISSTPESLVLSLLSLNFSERGKASFERDAHILLYIDPNLCRF